jgi:hypothetical protein
MRRQVRRLPAAVVAVGLMLAALVAPAAARTTGKESFDGVIVAAGESGTRTVVSSVIVFRGVFNGVGRVVEVPNRPGEPDTVLRDDLVFARGTMHLRSMNGAVLSMSLNPQTCVFKGRIKQTGKVQGGTGRFRHASGNFAGVVRARWVAARNADGTCSQEQALLLEVDLVSGRGTLSF